MYLVSRYNLKILQYYLQAISPSPTRNIPNNSEKVLTVQTRMEGFATQNLNHLNKGWVKLTRNTAVIIYQRASVHQQMRVKQSVKELWQLWYLRVTSGTNQSIVFMHTE